MIFRSCAVIPTHNHYRELPNVVKAMRAHDLTVFLVDDASSSPAREAIAALHAPEHGVQVLRQAVNTGKGGAVIAGLRHAATAGFSHVVQVDADGQHDLSALGTLWQAARDNPGAVISGRPVYDVAIPRGRLIARWLTHIWVWIETLSMRIADSMCGFRVYPLAATLRVLDHAKVGQRMDFRPRDHGAPLLERGGAAPYSRSGDDPEGNTSNFRLLRDNWLISRMHTRLVLGMLFHLPSILAHRPSFPEHSPHWSNLRERGTRFGMGFVQVCVRLLGGRGRGACRSDRRLFLDGRSGAARLFACLFAAGLCSERAEAAIPPAIRTCIFAALPKRRSTPLSPGWTLAGLKPSHSPARTSLSGRMATAGAHC